MPEDMYEDWRDPTIQLLERMAGWSSGPDGIAALTVEFNDEEMAQAIIQYFRVSC